MQICMDIYGPHVLHQGSHGHFWGYLRSSSEADASKPWYIVIVLLSSSDFIAI
jgi:hypothetical protein